MTAHTLQTEVFELTQGLPCGRNTLKLATTQAELEAVFKLRYRVFNEELGEGIPENVKTQMDVDGYDEHCDHLMVLDGNLVVGTYRLLYGPKRPARGFYTESEFNLSGLKVDPNESVEMGRGCIDPVHRKRTTLMALLWGLHRYMDMRRARYLLGCASLPPSNNNDVEATFELLQSQGRLKSIEGIEPLPANQFKGDAQLGSPKLPPLIALYLEFGAQIIGRPAFDPVFKCHDFFMLFDMKDLTTWGNELLARFDRRLLAAGDSKD